MHGEFCHSPERSSAAVRFASARCGLGHTAKTQKAPSDVSGETWTAPSTDEIAVSPDKVPRFRSYVFPPLIFTDQ